MKVLALEIPKPSAPTPPPAVLRAEAQRVWELNQSGILREIYFRADRPQAVLILECADVVEAQALLSTLPLVESGHIGFDIIPLASYSGYQRLFAQDSGGRRA